MAAIMFFIPSDKTVVGPEKYKNKYKIKQIINKK
jgi:hypothetical protein